MILISLSSGQDCADGIGMEGEGGLVKMDERDEDEIDASQRRRSEHGRTAGGVRDKDGESRSDGVGGHKRRL